MTADKEQNLPNKKGFTTGEVADLCHVTIPTVIKWIENGDLEGFKIPQSKNRRITRENLLAFMKKHEIPTTALEKNAQKILVVDDSEEILIIVKTILEKEGFEIRAVSKGFEAGIAKEFQPDLIILDILLPDIDGRKVCEYIREMPEMKNVAILAMSGIQKQEELNDLIQKGFNDFLKKPFDTETLLNRVRTLLGKSLRRKKR